MRIGDYLYFAPGIRFSEVDLTEKVVRISHDDQVVKTYDFSPETVGAWAEDANQQELVAEEVVKEQGEV